MKKEAIIKKDFLKDAQFEVKVNVSGIRDCPHCREERKKWAKEQVKQLNLTPQGEK